MTSTLRRAGIGLLVLYAAVAAVTHHFAPGGFRPLFDGFAPPEPYRWVKPPPEVAAGNRPPAAAEQDLTLGPEGSQVGNVTTSDAQAIAGLELGAVPPNPPDTAVRVRLTPLDAGTLAPLPPGLTALSNAYQVTITHQPSQTLVAALTKEGTIALTASTPGERMLYSPDGRQWEEKPSRPYGDTHGRFGDLQAPGYFLIAGPPPVATSTNTATGSDDPNTFLLVVVAAVPILGAILVLRPPQPVPAGRKRPPPPSRNKPKGKGGKRPSGKGRRRP